MTTVAIADAKGTVTYREVTTAGNVITLDGVRYKAVGTVTKDGHHIGVYRASEVRNAKQGNCPRCAGTGSFGNHGVCWECNGSGTRVTR